MKVMCKECRFKFAIIKKPNICPYCSAEGTIIDNSEGEAQKILDEVEKEEFNWGNKD
ncbi:hypothetical protein HYV79_02995 [Candidatus Woesearchaeota archaeon]|nr:hypothetical protein [Candidatus Woesearchaeota archaeon]